MSIEISLQDAHQRYADGGTVFVDIRDPQSFAQGHIPDAIALNNDNVAEFITSTDNDTPIVVVCYHGVSSRQATDVLLQQGLTDVKSMQGGFTAWQTAFPEDIERS